MKIFVGGLWSHPKRRELEELVSERLRGPWYRLHMPRGEVASCQVLEMTDLKDDSTEYCALIEIQPPRLGWEVLQHLDGLRTHGVKLRAHKWFPRKGVPDRRDHSGIFTAEVARDRRAGFDRRRRLQVDTYVPAHIEAMSGFQRSHGA
jgi:hypothetical protein